MAGKRADIKVGFLCNNNCRFCVQAHKKNCGDKSTEHVKKDLEEARKACQEVVFTGGEPTIRKDIFELVSYAKQLGFKVIQIQTNGRMFAYKTFCRKMMDAGATEFSPALHGHIPELHDFLTGNKGSFNQTVQGIKNLKELGQMVITNTVVVKPNYRFLPQLAKLLVKLKVNQFQFAFVHPVGNAMKNYNSIVPVMGLASPYIYKGLQIGIDAGVKVMAEAMPYCMMQGYEEYVSEKFIPEMEVREFDYVIEDYKKTRIEEGKMKFPQCNGCKYNGVCEGPWKEYPEKLGNSEFKPIK
jgi:MoaA/NifB/PqqE/SkfB family radical SAM enzyme